MAKIKFSKQTFARTGKAKIKKEILQAVESSPSYRKEIARVFQMANRRIQNIESKDLVSPAVEALNKGDIKGFTKFSMRQSWESLKVEYSKAVAFLRQPTSTASGTREYNKHLQDAYDLTAEEFNLMAQKMNDRLLSLSDSDFVERYLMRYKDFTGELERTVSDVSDQIESDSQRLQNEMERNIDDMVDEIEKVEKQMDSDLQRIMDSFDKFGL